MEDTSDTLRLAAEERAKQGIHELEFSFGGESDLHTHFKTCEKNPGHRRFISVNELNTSHLPEHPATDKIIAWIRRISLFTVKLSVHYVSPNRPPEFPLSDRRGRRVLTVGSGHVTDYPRERDIDKIKMPCPFTDCADLPGDHEVFGYITIVTAAHVVFDDEEAKDTAVEFFYDYPDDKRLVLTARGVKVGASSVEGDFCELLCVTHDIFLIRELKYNSLPLQKMGPIDYFLNEIIGCTPHQTAKLSVHYVSPNRPPGFPLSDRRGQRVLSVGSGHVTEVSLEGNNGQLPCPFTTYADLPGYRFQGYITIVTAAHVVFDDEEAKNTTVEMFYDDPDGRRHVTATGVKVRSPRTKEDVCELVCVTDYELFGKMKDNYLQWSVAEKKRFCDLFRNVLPGLEDIQCEKETGLKFIIKIRLSNPSEAVETFTTLMALTGEMVDSVLMLRICLQDVLDSTRCQTQYMHTLISFELHTARLIDDKRKTTPFLHLKKTLKNLRDTLTNGKIDSPQMCQNIFSSVITELAKYYSTVEIMEERLYACSSCITEIYSRNIQKVVDISNDTATVEVTFDRDAHFTTFHNQTIIMNYSEPICDFNQWKLNVKDCQPELPHFRDNERLSVPGIHNILMDRLKFSGHYTCKLCNRRCTPEDNQCKPGYCKYKSEDSKCNKDDMLLVHIGHPHGQSKRVTIGRQIDCLTGHGYYHQLYTAPTCPGCSGGPVWMIPASEDLSGVYGVPHHGHYGNELNSGCSWTMYPERFRIM